MDDTTKTTNTAGPTGPAGDPREELRAQLQTMGKAAGELLEQLVKVPATLAQIPLQAMPEETANHARNAANEGFAAVRTLLDGISRGLDDLMTAQRDRMSKSGEAHTHTPPASYGSEAHGMEGDTTAHDTSLTNGSTTHLDEEP
ncbi:MAG: hypothetical protein ACR2M0_15210 [Chloroflexia bacterium]